MHLTSIGSGLVGQGLNFVAMLLPILLGRLDQVAFLVAASAIAGVAAYTFTWSYASVYPGIVRAHEAAVATTSSATLLVLGTLLLLVSSTDLSPLPAPARQIALWAGALTLPLGLNLMSVAMLVRNRDYAGISRLRLVSGISNALFVLVACLSQIRYPPLLVIPTALSLAATALWGIGQNWTQLRRQIDRSSARPGEMWSYLGSYADAAVAALLGGAAFQLVGIATPLIGAAAHGWAVAIRFAGGFSTVSQQVLAPMFESDFAHQLREGNSALAAADQRRAYFLGLGYAALCAPIVCAIIVLVDADRAVVGTDRALLLLGAALFTIAILSTSFIPRNLVIAGGQRMFLRWAAVKVTLSAAALAATAGPLLLITLAGIEAVFQFAYYVAATKQVASRGTADEDLEVRPA